MHAHVGTSHVGISGQEGVFPHLPAKTCAWPFPIVPARPVFDSAIRWKRSAYYVSQISMNTEKNSNRVES